MLGRNCVLFTIILFLFVHTCFPMTYDNQFFPLGARPYSRKDEQYSNVIPEIFGVLSDKTFALNGEDTGLFELFGNYNLNAIGQALEAIGQPNPLRSEWQGMNIPWSMGGRLQGLGADIYYNQSITDHFSCGASILVMNVKTQIDFHRSKGDGTLQVAGPGDEEELDRDRLQANKELGLTGLISNRSGFGDLDAYVRVGNMWFYPDKFRRIDAGLRFGVLFPTGLKRNINNPASIPFAGNGLWGLYVAGDLEFEVKEDIKVGVWTRIIQRLSQTRTFRVPTNLEPINFGAVVGQFAVHPGFSIVFFPYFMWEDLRNGFGFAVSYLFVHQYASHWTDKREDKSVPVNLVVMRGLSTWTAEYVSVNMLYDFSKRVGFPSYAPTLSLYWDIPVRMISAKKVSRTNRVTLGVEFNY